MLDLEQQVFLIKILVVVFSEFKSIARLESPARTLTADGQCSCGLFLQANASMVIGLVQCAQSCIIVVYFINFRIRSTRRNVPSWIVYTPTFECYPTRAN